MQTIRHTIKYFRELLVAPYRLFKLQQELQRLSDQIRSMSQVLGNFLLDASSDTPANNKCALMTVVIMRENVAFLDEWIGHHLQLGVDHVFIYDNSMSEYDNAIGCAVSGGKAGSQASNKHRVDYASILGEKSSDDFIASEVDRLLKKYPDQLTIIPWSRRDENGIVCYFQREAIIDFVLRNRTRFSHGLTIDTDEFLISDNGWKISDLIADMAQRGISTGLIGQRRFLYRFCNIGAPVRSIPWVLHHDAGTAEYGACKSIFRLDLFTGCGQDLIVHYIPTLLGNGRFRWQDMRFHHYGWPGFREHRTLADLNETERQFLASEFRRDQSMFRYLKEQSQ